MNSDSEALQSLFAQLLHQTATDASSQTNQSAENEMSMGVEAEDDLLLAEIDPLDSEDISLLVSNDSAWDFAETLPTLATPQIQEGQPFSLGEIPVVQDRFKALLKRRMETEIQSKPPLFPWETEVVEYPDGGFEAVVPDSSFWANHLATLNLPAVPQTVLLEIFERCLNLVNSSVREGVRLIRAVETLFPDQSGALNEVASLVLLGAARGGSNLPPTYEQATASQKMHLSLLAAREIMGHLRLVVSPSQPVVERSWETAVGMVMVEAFYEPEIKLPKLRVQCQVPAGGLLQMSCGKVFASAHRPDAGCLSVEIFDPQPDTTYSLEVRLDQLEGQPLSLAVCPVS